MKPFTTARRALAALLVAVIPVLALAAPKTATPKVNFTKYKLKNGLTVLYSRDVSAPVVSVAVTYNVGSLVEPVGRTGFAHLFEHMMFQGSANVGKGEYMGIIQDIGGSLNGTTGQDRTNYFSTVPANQLELPLFLEADRMATLDVSQVNLDNQRAVVQEERRQSYDNRPYGQVFETLLKNTSSIQPYTHAPIGSMEDLNKATLQDVQTFFANWYGPSNAVLSVVGDFEEAKLKALIDKHFGPIPARTVPPLPSLKEPFQKEEKRVALKDPLAPLPSYTAAWQIPHNNHKDIPALDMLCTVLSGGKSTRLYQSLVEEQQVATSAMVGVMPRRGMGLLLAMMSFAPGQSVEKAEQALEAEVERVKTSGVTDAEMETARRQARQAQIRGLRTVEDRATNLGEYAVVFGNPNRINTYLPDLYKVTPADVQRVAKEYLVKNRRTVVITEPAPSPTTEEKS